MGSEMCIRDRESLDGEREYFPNPALGKNLNSQYFNLKEILPDGRLRGNFFDKPIPTDFYLFESELKLRPWIEVFLMFIFVLPFWLIIKNFKKDKIDG